MCIAYFSSVLFVQDTTECARSSTRSSERERVLYERERKREREREGGGWEKVTVACRRVLNRVGSGLLLWPVAPANGKSPSRLSSGPSSFFLSCLLACFYAVWFLSLPRRQQPLSRERFASVTVFHGRAIQSIARGKMETKTVDTGVSGLTGSPPQFAFPPPLVGRDCHDPPLLLHRPRCCGVIELN